MKPTPRIIIIGIGFAATLSACTSQPAGADDIGAENPQIGDVIGIYAGGDITCAHRFPAELRCWGRNDSAGTGMGDAGTDYEAGTHRRLASDPGVEIEAGVRGLANAHSTSCLLQDDRRVRCWGASASKLAGNFGDPVKIGDDENLLEAPPLDLGGEVQEVAIGQTHACALFAGGEVRCWGENGEGYLGLGHVDQVGDAGPASIKTIPAVSLGEKASSVSAGKFTSCAVLESGDARCWGYDGPNLLGLPGWENDVTVDRLGDDETPTDYPTINLAGGPVQSISATGGRHVCALHQDGSVSCWGELLAALGHGDGDTHGPAGSGVLPTEVGLIDIGAKATKLVTGQLHTCALLEDKTVKCWGDNEDGQLGYGDTAHRGWFESPSSYGTVELGGPVADLAAGAFHTCALLEDGDLRCWGDNRRGQLGFDNGFEPVGDDELPSDVPVVSFE